MEGRGVMSRLSGERGRGVGGAGGGWGGGAGSLFCIQGLKSFRTCHTQRDGSPGNNVRTEM